MNKASIIKCLGNRCNNGIFLFNFVIQNCMALIPNSCEIFVYKLLISATPIFIPIVWFWFALFIKSNESFIMCLILFRDGDKILCNNVDNLCVKYAGPATTASFYYNVFNLYILFVVVSFNVH